MMRIPGRKRLRRALRPLSKRLFPGAIVLGYHRVAEASSDPLGLAVRPAHFARQVEALAERREIVRLGALPGLQAAGEPLERYAALTFDDGYADFAETVLPIIEARGVPATVFVATGFIGRHFWWDEVAALLMPAAGDRPLDICRHDREPWRYDGLDNPSQRAAAVRDLCNRMACSDEKEIGAVIAQLLEWTGAGEAPKPTAQAMRRAQLEMLARHPLAEIGAHTVSHGCLATLPPEGQLAEMVRCKETLETLQGVAVTTFSYPNGSCSRATPRLVEKLGFSCACASMDGLFGRRTDRYLIPRLWTPDVGGAEFLRWLGRWAAGFA